MDEMSVLDYICLKIHPQNWRKPILPDENSAYGAEALVTRTRGPLDKPADRIAGWIRRVFVADVTDCFQIPGWAALLSFLLALAAQLINEPGGFFRQRNPLSSGALFGASAALIVIFAIVDHNKKGKSSGFRLFSPRVGVDSPNSGKPRMNERIFPEWLLISAGSALIAFFLFGGNRFNFLNLTFWALSILAAVFGVAGMPQRGWTGRVRKRWTNRFGPLVIRVSPWNLLWAGFFFITIYFRFHWLGTVPADMFSDHAEKLLDVKDVLDGKYPIFFLRNTGREAFQFYWTALMIRLFDSGISFASLKIGTALAGVFALPFVYGIGKKFANRWVGLAAMLLCGVAYWPNVISRVALRFAFYPMFTAPAFYFLICGLTERKRWQLILSGIFLGIGLQGYSAMRIVPTVFLLFFLFYLIQSPKEERQATAKGFGFLVLFAVLFSLPLLRILTVMPDAVLYRSLTRLTGIETAVQASPAAILLENTWKSLIMPFWDNGRIWVHSIPFRPALEPITAALFFIGLIYFLIRIIRFRRWQDIALILSIPLWMLPSILSLAFPDENPSLNRTGAAMIPISVLAAYGFFVLIRALIHSQSAHRTRLIFIGLSGLALLTLSCLNNYQLVFETYRLNYERNAWNTRQMGSVIQGFSESVGAENSAYVIPYPHWVDTRLVGINAGQPGKDYALPREHIESVSQDGRTLLFLYKPTDQETAAELHSVFPNGKEKLFESSYPDKSFFGFLVP